MGGFSLSKFVTRSPKAPLFFIGTRAELIKVMPVVTRLDKSGVKVSILWAGLHSDAFLSKHNSGNIIFQSLFRSGKDKDSISKVLIWFILTLGKILMCGIYVRRSRKKPSTVIVHGDTLCTILGGLLAKACGAKLMHIEAGVRSGNYLRPFPEEISRRFVSQLTNVHFAPGITETLNLKNYRGEIINTFHNTSRDALLDNISNLAFENHRFILVTLHRTELLSNKKKFSEITEKLIELSKSFQVKWFVGNHERVALKGIKYIDKVLDSKIELCGRTGHAEFVKILVHAHCVITDSGGLQSECNDLGIPVIVHRKETEYSNPENSPWVLTGWKLSEIDLFLATLGRNKVPRGVPLNVLAADITAERIKEETEGVSP
jgi:UDP-N-acetylglucosamine 2-epimerase (non-hydrolysing)